MIFWRNWTRVLDPLNSSSDWFWVNDIMGPPGPNRWVYIEKFYFFKDPKDATLFKLMWNC